MMDTYKRTILKSITYRVVGTAITIPFTGLSTAIGVHVLLTILYYIHERVWTKIRWGIE